MNRPGGLCWHDYYTPAVRALYVSKSKYAQGHHAKLDFNGKAPEDAEPLRAGPGTKDRLKALAERAALGLSLFRRGDVGWEANQGIDVEATKYSEPWRRGVKK